MVGVTVLRLLEQLVAFDVTETVPGIKDVALARFLVSEFDLVHGGGSVLKLVSSVDLASVAHAALVAHFKFLKTC